MRQQPLELREGSLTNEPNTATMNKSKRAASPDNEAREDKKRRKADRKKEKKDKEAKRAEFEALRAERLKREAAERVRTASLFSTTKSAPAFEEALGRSSKQWGARG
eukprot:c20311_g1_i3.p4 GENE.c20311_g1_i3~~c20311_g1_i3.p4  ORF type:complete len:107 (+),score=26.97 c20311_g1_i3:643-963(+)